MDGRNRGLTFFCFVMLLAGIAGRGLINAQPSVPELIIPFPKISLCPGSEVDLQIIIDGIAPVSVIYEYNGTGGNANSSTNTITIPVQDTGIFVITSYSDFSSGYIDASDTIFILDDSLDIYFTGGGFQCDSSLMEPLTAHFLGIAPFMLVCTINDFYYAITAVNNTYVFALPYDFTMITQQISDQQCTREYIDTLYVQTGFLAPPAIVGDADVCANSTSTYIAENDTNITNWYIPGVSVYSIDTMSDGEFVTVDWTSPGEYIVRASLIDPETGCESPESELEVTVHGIPLHGEMIDTTVCIAVDGSIQIDIPVEEDDDIFWPTLGYHNVSAILSGAGIYPFIYTSRWGCTDSSAVQVIDSCATGLFVPEAFTPNGDQINDYLELFGTYGNLEFSVYSPSGILLFRSTTIGDFWDGTSGGKQVPDGSYYWHAIYTDGNNAELKKSGRVTIIR